MDTYTTFKETKQEPLRLKSALQGFFSESPEESAHREEYLRYLKFRIRPAVEQLILEDAVEKIEELEHLGCFHEKEVEHFIQIAQREGRMISLMWLLQLKNEKYGYQDRDFSL